MFNNKQIEVLDSEIASNRVKTRSKGNINLSYLEGFDVINTANVVFGYGNWSYSISKLEKVSEEINQNQNTVVCYKSIVTVTVHDTEHLKQIIREDVGTGIGISKTLADAHEGASKEAVTDALKRAMRGFGNQFGLSLYDKSKNHFNSHQQNINQNYQPMNNNKHQQNYPQQTQATAQNNQVSNNTQTRNNSNQTNQHQPSYDQYEYASLFNLGLTLSQRDGFLFVEGSDIYSKKDSIRACGFLWSPDNKKWYKQIEQGAA